MELSQNRQMRFLGIYRLARVIYHYKLEENSNIKGLACP